MNSRPVRTHTLIGDDQATKPSDTLPENDHELNTESNRVFVTDYTEAVNQMPPPPVYDGDGPPPLVDSSSEGEQQQPQEEESDTDSEEEMPIV